VAEADRALEVLAEPRRRAVFDVVLRAVRPVTRDAVAAAAGIDRKLAAHHLDRLVDAGLLVASFARPPGRRGGPGAGRPAKQYAATRPEVALSVPPRHYDVAARIMATALVAGGDPRTAVPGAAQDEGRRVGREHRVVPGGRSGTRDPAAEASALLDELGYEPHLVQQDVRLSNCPFHALLDVSVDLVCGINQAFCTGLLDGLDLGGEVRAVLDPQPGRGCCVRLSPVP
jgi:predicted ArsR family transcriptional regulator